MANLSSLTFKEFEGQVRADTGAVDYADPPTDLIMRWTNVILQKIALLTAPIDNPWGRNSTSLTNLNAVGKYVNNAVTWTYSTKTLTNFVAAGATLAQTYVGGWAFFYDTANARWLYGLVDTVDSTGNTAVLRFYVSTGAASDITGAQMRLWLKPNPAYYDGANLSSVSVRDVVNVVDGTNGNCVRLSPDEFAAISKNPNLDDSVCMQFAGEAVYLGKGADISSFGTLTMTYNEKPASITASTDLIDLLPEHLPTLQSEVMRWVFNYINKPIPENMADPMADLMEKFKEHAKSEAAYRAKQDVPARRY